MLQRPSRGFTLIEMLMVMVIIAIIAGLIVGVAGYANKKAANTRTMGEIEAIKVACEGYKTDNGVYPREVNITEPQGSGAAPIDPRLHGNPTDARYQTASKFLYQQLTGDVEPDGRPGDTVGDVTNKVYLETKPSMLVFNSNRSAVLYMQDPYGFSYGYSTAAAKQEDEYRLAARTTSGSVERTAQPQGYNPSFDIWSTAGITTGTTDQARLRWIKNW